MSQAPNIINVTEDGTTLLMTTGVEAAGVSVMIGSDESIGSGTMSLGVLPQHAVGDANFSVNYIDATLDAAHNKYYRVGGGMAVYIKLAGSTAADCDVICAAVPGID